MRFLGRKVYLGAIVILISSAMRQGPTPRRVRELSARFGVDQGSKRHAFRRSRSRMRAAL